MDGGGWKEKFAPESVFSPLTRQLQCKSRVCCNLCVCVCACGWCTAACRINMKREKGRGWPLQVCVCFLYLIFHFFVTVCLCNTHILVITLLLLLLFWGFFFLSLFRECVLSLLWTLQFLRAPFKKPKKPKKKKKQRDVDMWGPPNMQVAGPRRLGQGSIYTGAVLGFLVWLGDSRFPSWGLLQDDLAGWRRGGRGERDMYEYELF